MTRRADEDDGSSTTGPDVLGTSVTPATDLDPSALLHDGDPRTALPQSGDVIAEKYRIETRLGAGGMGAVFRAVHVVTGKAVAMKWTLQPIEDGRVRARFLREARAAARIDHPNVVNVFDVGEVGARGYLVMELLHGETLKSRLQRGVTPDEVIDLLLPAMRGVVAIHAAGVVHRDLKPDNIFLCVGPDGTPRQPKVLDFGISAFIESEAADDTRPAGVGSTLIGTPAYMSPERLSSALGVDERCDIYSLGVILYEALTGHRPFRGASFAALSAAIADETPEPPCRLQPNVSPALSAVVLRALSKRPAERFDSVQQLIDALEATRVRKLRGTRWRFAAVPVVLAIAAVALVAMRSGGGAPPANAASVDPTATSAATASAPPYLSGPACSECVERACGKQQESCYDDGRCAALIERARASSEPLIVNRQYLGDLDDARWALDHDWQHGSWFKLRNSLTQCVRDRCLEQCQVGRKLSCVGNFDYAASYPSTTNIRLHVASTTNARGLSGWTVNACAPAMDCERSMGTSTTDHKGFATLVVDLTKIRPNTRSLPEFDSTLELSGDADYSARVLYQTAPYLDGYYSRWLLQTREENRKIAKSRGLPTLDQGVGSLDVQVFDCEGWIAWGVSLEVWRYSTSGYQRCTDCTVAYPDDAGNPDPSLSRFNASTRASAVVRLPPGEIMLKARDTATGRLVSVLPRINVRGGYEQAALLYPASRQQMNALSAEQR